MALEQAGVQLVAAGGDVYITTINNATKATNSFVGATESGGGRVGAAGQVMIGALRQIGTIAVDVFAKAAKATAAFVGDSVHLAGDFEAGMLNFQAVAGKDVDTKGLEKFKDLFISLGKELPVSTSDVEKAAIEMVKGGIDPAIVAAGGLRQNIQFAAAAMDGDLVEAANVSAKILGGWADANATAQQKAEFLTHATDQLTKAANASSVDVHELSLGIFNAQGIAKTAGVSFDDLTTTLAALSPRFASSSEAGNSLKNVIARLQPSTKPAIAAMEGLGLITADGANKFYDAQGKFIGFSKASQVLQDSLRGLTQQQKQAVLQTIFGNDAMNAAAGLADLGAAGYQKMADALAGANGVTENAALKQQGYNTALENAKGSVEALQITVGSALLPVLTDLLNNTIAPAVNTITDFTSALTGSDEAFNRLSPTMQGMVTTLSSLSGYFTAVVEDGDYLNDFLVDLPAPIQGVVGGIGMLIAAFNPLQAYIGAVVEDGDTLNDFLTDIPKPMQTVARALGELVNWLGSAGSAADDFGGVVDDLSGIFQHYIGVVEDVLGGYQAIAQAILPQVSKFWQDHGTEITTFLQATYDKIIRIVNLALDLYDAVVPKALKSVAGWIDEHATGIQAVLSGAWDAISGIVDGALTLIEGTIKIALDLIHGDWAKAWGDLQQMSATFVLDLERVIEGFLNIIAGFFNTNLQEIADLWSHNWEELYRIATETDWVKVGQYVVDGILQGLKDNWDHLMGWLSDKAHDLVKTALDAIGAGSPAKEFYPVGEFATTGIMAGFEETWPQLTDQVGTLSADLISSMSDIGTQMQSAIADSFGATASIDRQIAKNLDAFKDVLPQYQRYTQGALQEAQNQAEAFLDPAEGAKYFKMKSAQILEYAKLQKDLSEATNADDRARIQQQMLLINKAQTAEIAQFDATKQASSPLMDIVNQINDIMKSIAGINLTDDQIHIVDQLATIWSALQTPTNARQQAYVNPPMTQYPSAGSNTNTSTMNVNMPIYTNNSPAALQQSWAIVQASMA